MLGSLQQVVVETLLVNTIRTAIDKGGVRFYEANQHPTDLQRLEVNIKHYDEHQRRFAYPSTSDPQIREFLTRKVYWLGFRAGDKNAGVSVEDGYDCEHLATSPQRMKQLAQVLEADSMVRISDDGVLARPAQGLLREAVSFEAQLEAALSRNLLSQVRPQSPDEQPLLTSQSSIGSDAPTKCPICSLDSGVKAHDKWASDGTVMTAMDYFCPRCGGFPMTDDLRDLFKESPKDRLRPYLSAHTRELNEKNERPELLTARNWREYAKEHSAVPVRRRLERLLLLHAPDGTPDMEQIEFKFVQDYPLLNVASADAAIRLIKDLQAKGYIDGSLTMSRWIGSLTPDGVEEVERIRDAGIKQPGVSNTGPVAKAAKRPTRFETARTTYSKIENIGEGFSGFVDRVRDDSGDVYALKMLKPDEISKERSKRFANEAYSSDFLNHPNIVRVLDHGFVMFQDKKCPFYVIEVIR